ncbi:protein SERAC1 [Anthonomus grandis grandis]|uniref:protein SERAC1 n=1 Tax=Anthonomus grandis grandis TaxID=2921223 RepID=UPI002165F494|nr:protein SERAC1 [Anthonomus grandis grandis]XP_050312673.1 protein SERAC1 [Anthonomus grandis grandis]
MIEEEEEPSMIRAEFNVSDNNGCLVAVPGPSRGLWLQNVIYSLRYHVVPALAAFLANSIYRSLAPLQRIPLSLPSGVVRIRFRRTTKRRLAVTDGAERHGGGGSDVVENDTLAERCVRCEVLHEPPGGAASADVIFIHGLHGGLDKTWTQGTWRQKSAKLQDLEPPEREGPLKRTITNLYTSIPTKVRRKTSNENPINIEGTSEVRIAEEVEQEEEEEDISRCWPKDWLPLDCPGVRILAINYTTDKLWRPLWEKMTHRTDLPARSKEMTDELMRHRVGERPIVWVGHSKGGLYIKQILLYGARARDEGDEARGNIYKQTRAIMFYSVPHKGSPIADMTFPFFRRSIEVLEVRTNCEFVLNLHKRFLEMLREEQGTKPEIFSFIDTENTPVGFTSLKFISYESADPDVGVKCDVPLDHREICKPAGRDCFLYLELVRLIRRSVLNETS